MVFSSKIAPKSKSLSLSSQLQKRDFDFGAIFDENTKTIALLFGQKSSIFITLSSAVAEERVMKMDAIFDAKKYQGYSLGFS